MLLLDEISVEHLLKEDCFAVAAETLAANAAEIFAFDPVVSLSLLHIVPIIYQKRIVNKMWTS